MSLRDADSQALSSARADSTGYELAALYTLQHGCARNAEDLDGVEHRDIAAGASSTKRARRFVGHADLPRCSGR